MAKIIFFSFFIHTVFLLSIFDIYFKSPIVRDVTPYESQHKAVADRLVLFSVDGLRAESFFEHNWMPYLRSVAKTRGRWGISHTRVPTESRPGHVAIIGGFYEDPSAVAKGWKKNPVDFDSVFNRSRNTWAWGAEDIVHIFSQGQNDGNIITDVYDIHQSFSTDTNTTLLDKWVFSKVEIFFAKARHKTDLHDELLKDKLVFFLHLLSTDTSGHTHKPGTQDFITNLKYVDEGIQQMEHLFNEYFLNDNKTTFVMTSDHGMTDWGSHGSGDTHETELPYIVWGAGIDQKPSNYSKELDFGLPRYKRLDINQADFAPYMSTVISIPVPVNSIGKLPHDLLNLTLENRAKAIYSNSRQLASQYERKRLQVEENAIRALYWPYKAFDRRKYEEMMMFTEKLLADGQYEKLIILSEEIMDLSLSGLNYYHNYYQGILLAFVSLSFFGWIVYLLTTLIEQKKNISEINIRRKKPTVPAFENILCGFLCISFTALIWVQNLPIQYYVYAFIPVFLWCRVLASLKVWTSTAVEIVKQGKIIPITVQIVCYLVGTIALVMSFSHRWMLSVPLFGMGIWPLFTNDIKLISWPELVFWASSCCMLGLFSFLPVVGKNTHMDLVLVAGLIWLLISTVFIYTFLLPIYKKNSELKRDFCIVSTQVVLLCLALHNVYVQGKRFEESTPVKLSYQIEAWLIALISLILPMFSTLTQVWRLQTLSTSLLTIYLMLSVSHEGLFFVTLMGNLMCWLCIEHKLAYNRNAKLTSYTFVAKENDLKQTMSIERGLTQQDFRRAFFFLLYIILSFFGTGNIASLNSFEVRWVTCFVTTFKPFLITSLVLFKTMLPFLSVASIFRAISLNTKAPTGYSIIIVLIFSNMMGVQLLFCVKNTGSWLEIGTSISQYVIVQLITLFIVLLHYVAKGLTEINLYNVSKKKLV